MDNIEVTIICYTYNHEKYIRQCLDSFLNQITNFNYEIIVHDDASKDNTQEIIKDYAIKYPSIVKPLLQRENQYQKGIDLYQNFVKNKVKGKYIAICEGDDFWINPNKLQMQFNVLEENSDCSFCTCKVLCCDKDGKILKKTYPQEYYKIDKTQIIATGQMVEYLYTKSMYPFQTSSYFMKKNVCDETGNIFHSLFDRNILLTATLFGNIYYIDEPLSAYRRYTEYSWSLNSKKMSVQKRYQQDYNLLKYDLIFDQYTKFKYHQMVIKKACSCLNKISKTDCEETKKVLSEFNIKHSDLVNNIGLKRTTIFYCSIYFPHLMAFIRKNIRKTL